MLVFSQRPCSISQHRGLLQAREETKGWHAKTLEAMTGRFLSRANYLFDKIPTSLGRNCDALFHPLAPNHASIDVHTHYWNTTLRSTHGRRSVPHRL
jgi:hypothetical protein